MDPRWHVRPDIEKRYEEDKKLAMEMLRKIEHKSYEGIIKR